MAKFKIGDSVWNYDRAGRIRQAEITSMSSDGDYGVFGLPGWHPEDELFASKEEAEKAGTLQERVMCECLGVSTKILKPIDPTTVSLSVYVDIALVMFNDRMQHLG